MRTIWSKNGVVLELKQVGMFENMKKTRVIMVGFLLVLHVIDCSSADLEVKGNGNTGSLASNTLKNDDNHKPKEKTGTSVSGIESKDVDQAKKGSAQVGDSNNGVENQITKGDQQSELSEELDPKELPTKKGDVNKMKGEELKPKEIPKEGGNEGDSGTVEPVKKEGSQGEECGNMCTDDDKKLVACLRVPGNESPDLLLFIENKGKDPLTVTITAPNFVQLEKGTVQLKENEHTELKVSIQSGGTENLINLTAGNGLCNLDFKDLITPKESDNSSKSKNINSMTWTSTFAIVSFVALLILASGWLCIRNRRKNFSSNGSKYQRLAMELPVSGGRKSDSDVNDGWDNSWGDNWDDEEAPKTPSMPLTPSLSSKGLATRRVNKDVWKD